MKTKKPAKKTAAAKPKPSTINLEYVNEIADESIATILALRALVNQLVAQQENSK
jgi:hypothetical protein